MKKNKRSILYTIAILVTGIAVLMGSVTYAKSSIMDNLSYTLQAAENEESTASSANTKKTTANTEDTEETEYEETESYTYTTDEDTFVYLHSSGLNEDEIESIFSSGGYTDDDIMSPEELENYGKITFVYRGHVVTVYDEEETEETAKSNAKTVIDILYDEIKSEISGLSCMTDVDFENCDIRLDRQYHIVDSTFYTVDLNTEYYTMALLGIDMDKRVFTDLFAWHGNLVSTAHMDALDRNANWADTDEKKYVIYSDYELLSYAYLIDTFGLPGIAQYSESDIDVNDEKYMWFSEYTSEFSCGYLLENGMFVRLFYDRTDDQLVGFSIVGYDSEILNSCEYNKTEAGKKILEKYGLDKYLK